MKPEVEIWLRICVPFACLRNLNVTISWPFLFFNGSVPRLLLFRCGEYNVENFRSGEEELEKEIWGDCKREVWLCFLLFSSLDPICLGRVGCGGSVYNPASPASDLIWQPCRRGQTLQLGVGIWVHGCSEKGNLWLQHQVNEVKVRTSTGPF